MPIKRTRAPAKPRGKKPTDAGAAPGELILSQDDKRRLIMAHAAMRPTRDPVQLMSMWAGVMVAVLAVGVGWWWSVGSTIAGSYNAGGIMQGVRALAPEPGPKSEVQLELEKTGERLKALRELAEAQSKELEMTQALVASSSTGAFAPIHTTTTTTSTTEKIK